MTQSVLLALRERVLKELTLKELLNQFNYSFSIDLNKTGSSPKFVYFHELSGHPPFYSDETGQLTNRWPDFHTIKDGDHGTKGKPELIAIYKEGYRAKVRHSNGLLLEQLRTLVNESEEKKIIIIQGDHGGGAFYRQSSDGDLTMERLSYNMDKSCLKERFSPYFAVYTNIEELGSMFSKRVDRSYSTVNTYRIIFDYLFSGNIGTLETERFFVNRHNQRLMIPVSEAQVEVPCTGE